VLQPYLSAAQIDLFLAMPAAEQRHALAVLRTLQERGYSEPPLAQAALLHDVGKIMRAPAEGERGQDIAVWHRVAAVLVKAATPSLLEQVALDRPGSWRFPFHVLLHHAERGAEMAAAVGTDPRAVALVRWHDTSPEDSDLDSRGRALLSVLQAADGQN
jgi:hypothetical protein